MELPMPAARIAIQRFSGSSRPVLILDLSNLNSDDDASELISTINEARQTIRGNGEAPFALVADLRNSSFAAPTLAALMDLVRAPEVSIDRLAFVCEAMMERLAFRQIRRFAAMEAEEFRTLSSALAFVRKPE
jgi:hypothetical protein